MLAQYVRAGAHADRSGRQILANYGGDDGGGAPPATIHGGDIKNKNKNKKVNFVLYICLFILFCQTDPVDPITFSHYFYMPYHYNKPYKIDCAI